MFGIFSRAKKDRWEDLVGKKIIYRVMRMALDGGFFEQELRTGIVEKVGADLVMVDGVWREQYGVRVHAVFDDCDNPKPVDLP